VNRWSAPLGQQGAWVELSWEKPQRVRHVQITFDTGFERELTLSSSDAANRGIIRAPQPETVKDYQVLGRRAGSSEFFEIASVRGNYQRLNRHTFEPVEVEAIRLHVTATNGDEKARVFEVRCYG
jgi:hypothetical protein